MFRRRRHEPDPAPTGGVDLTVLSARWRAPVEEAIATRARFRELVARVPDGPLRHRLDGLAERVDTGVLAAWATAERAQAAEHAMEILDPDRVSTRFKDARRRLDQARGTAADTAALEQEVAALSDQHASVNRLLNGLDDAAERLRVLDLRLDTAVARAAELVLHPGDVAGFESLDRELADEVAGLDAFRAGLDAMG